MAVQLARHAKARVIGIGRARVRDLVLDLGADEFVETHGAEIDEKIDDADVVFDLVGGELLKRCSSMVRRGGIVVSVVESPDRNGMDEDTRSRFFVVEPDRVQLMELARLIDTGQLRTVVAQTADLRAGQSLFAAKQAGGVPGKVVLRPRR